MSKKIIALSIAVLILAFSFTVAMKDDTSVKTDVSSVKANSFAASDSASTTSFEDYIGGQIGNITNIGGIIGDVSDIGSGLGDLIGGSGLGSLGGDSSGSGIGGAFNDIGNALSGIIGGNSSNGSGGGTGSVTYPINTETLGYIDIVPVVSGYATTTETQAPTTTQEAVVNETVDFAATANPYQKPTTELRGGDTGEGVKWMQWIFIYTRYGLGDDGITGVFDEDTMAVVKKLQKLNGMTVDGIVDAEVIAQIERLYAQGGITTTAEATTQANSETYDYDTAEKEDYSDLYPLMIAVIVLWILAIVFVIIIFVKKKKKKSQGTSAQKAEPEQEAPAEGNNEQKQ